MRQALGSISMLNGCRHYCTDPHSNSQVYSRSLRVYAGGVTQQELPIPAHSACKSASPSIKLSVKTLLQGFTEFTEPKINRMIMELLCVYFNSMASMSCTSQTWHLMTQGCTNASPRTATEWSKPTLNCGSLVSWTCWGGAGRMRRTLCSFQNQ